MVDCNLENFKSFIKVNKFQLVEKVYLTTVNELLERDKNKFSIIKVFKNIIFKIKNILGLKK